MDITQRVELTIGRLTLALAEKDAMIEALQAKIKELESGQEKPSPVESSE